MRTIPQLLPRMEIQEDGVRKAKEMLLTGLRQERGGKVRLFYFQKGLFSNIKLL